MSPLENLAYALPCVSAVHVEIDPGGNNHACLPGGLPQGYLNCDGSATITATTTCRPLPPSCMTASSGNRICLVHNLGLKCISGGIKVATAALSFVYNGSLFFFRLSPPSTRACLPPADAALGARVSQQQRYSNSNNGYNNNSYSSSNNSRNQI